MGRELYLTNSSGTLVDITKFVDRWPTQIIRTSDGPEPQAKFEVKGALMGATVEDTLSAILTGGPQYGRVVLFRDTNYTPTVLHLAGTIKLVELTPRTGAPNYTLTVSGFLDELNIPIGYIAFPNGTLVYNGTTYDCRYDSHRIRYLLDQFLPTWDHTNTHVADPAYQVYSGLATGHYKTTVLKLIKEFSGFPGTDSANPRIPRRWFPWAELTGTTTFSKYIDYSPRESLSPITPTLHNNPSAATDIGFYDAVRKIDGSSIINSIIISGPQGEPATVSWVNAVNVSVTGSTLTKNGGAAAWDAGAFGEQSISSDGGYVEFGVPTTTKSVACGFSTTDPSQTEASIHFRVQTNGTGGYSIQLDSTNLFSTGTYAANDRFRVEIRRNQNSSGTVYWQGFVHQNSGTGFRQIYAIAFTPAQLDDGTHGGSNNFPLFPDTSIFTSAGVIKDVFIRSHSYNTFTRNNSIGSPNNYGPKWAADVLHDDALNSYELRRQRAEAVFNARAYPRDTFTCTTNGIQVNGTRYLFQPGTMVNVYEPSFSWTPNPLFVARVTYDWGEGDGYPIMKMELGDRILEDGEVENIVLQSTALDTEAPDVPTGLNVLSQTGTNAGVDVVFDWDQTTHDEQFIDIRCIPPANWPSVIRRFSATVDSGLVQGLMVNTTYTVDISATDFAGNSSPFGNGITFTTDNPAPQPPTSPTVSANTYDPASHMSRITGTWTHSVSQFVQGYIIYIVESGTTDPYYVGYTNQYTFTVHPGSSVYFYLKAVSVSGQLSAASTNSGTVTGAGPNAFTYIYNPSFEEGVRFHPEWPSGWAKSSPTTVTRVTTQALDGQCSASLDSTGGGSTDITSSMMVVTALRKLSTRFAAMGNVAGTYLQADILWFKNDGTSNGTYNLWASATVNNAWTPYKASEIDIPANTAFLQIKFTNNGSGSRILYIDSVFVQMEIENQDIVDHTISLTKVYKYLDDALYNPDFYIVTTKDPTQPDGWTLANDAGCTQAVDVTKDIKGGYSLKHTLPAVALRACTTTSSPVAIMNTAAGGVGNQYAVQWRVSFNATSSTGTYAVKANWYGSSGLISTQTLASGSLVAGGSTKYGTVVPPAGCIYGYFVLATASTGTGNTIWWSACKFEEALAGVQMSPQFSAAEPGSTVTNAEVRFDIEGAPFSLTNHNDSKLVKWQYNTIPTPDNITFTISTLYDYFETIGLTSFKRYTTGDIDLYTGASTNILGILGKINLNVGISQGYIYNAGNGTAAELILAALGDQYGDSSLSLTNRGGANGATFTTTGPALVDFIFAHSGGSSNERLEGRSVFTFLGAANEWQFGAPGGPNTAFSDAGFYQALSVPNTSTPALTTLRTVRSAVGAVTGFGSQDKLQLDDSSTTDNDALSWITDWIDATHATLTSRLQLQLINNGAALATALTITPTLLQAAGTIESLATGFKFPDASIQNTAVDEKTVEVDFGSTPTSYAKFTITDSSVTTSHLIMMTQSGVAATGKSQDENEMDSLVFRAVGNTGNMTVYATSIDGPVVGKFKVNYILSK